MKSDQLNELNNLSSDFLGLNTIVLVDINDIEEPEQDRKHFDLDELKSLAQNILEIGLIYTLIVKKGSSEGKYILVGGGRRIKALKMLVEEGHNDFQRVSCKVIDDKHASEIMLSDNIHRADLNPVETAFALKVRLDDKNNDINSQSDLAKHYRKHRSYVSRYFKILEMPEEVLMLGLNGLVVSPRSLAQIAKLDQYVEACEAIEKGMDLKVVLKEFANEKNKKENVPAIKIAGDPLDTLCSFLSTIDLGDHVFDYKKDDPVKSLKLFIQRLEKDAKKEG